MSDYNFTLFETCELLSRSKKSISRYVRRGLLHPQQIKSQKGVLEYRFCSDDIETFKQREKIRRQDNRDRKTGHIDRKTGHLHDKETSEEIKEDKNVLSEAQDRKTGHIENKGQNEIINLLKETTGILKEQLNKKDEQIKDLGGKIDQLIERDRETNILLKGLQEKVLMLEKPKEKKQDSEKKEKPRKKEKRGFFNNFFN